jgi:hypothetical protein
MAGGLPPPGLCYNQLITPNVAGTSAGLGIRAARPGGGGATPCRDGSAWPLSCIAVTRRQAPRSRWCPGDVPQPPSRRRRARPLSPFRVEPNKPFGNPLLLLSDLVQCRPIPLSLGSPDIGYNTTAPILFICDSLRINARHHLSEGACSAPSCNSCHVGDVRKRNSSSTNPIRGYGVPH